MSYGILAPTTAQNVGMTEDEKRLLQHAMTLDHDRLHVSENDWAIQRILRTAYWAGWSAGDAYVVGKR